MRAQSGAAQAQHIAAVARAGTMAMRQGFRRPALLRTALRLLDLLRWSFLRSFSDISIGFAKLRPDYTPGGGPQRDSGFRRNDEKLPE